jgi:putative transposase
VHDQLASGRRFRILNIVDDVAQEWSRRHSRQVNLRPARHPRADAPIDPRGRPKTIVSDHGTELTSNAVLGWCAGYRVEWHHIARGKPTQNGFI